MERIQSTKTIEEYKQKSKNTINSMDKVFCQWAQKRDHPQNIEVLALDNLDSILQHSFAEINKKDGKDHEPSPLVAMQNSMDRYLRESNYEYSLLNNRFFKGSRDVLEGKTPLLREKGLGKKPKKTNSLTRQEEGILWNVVS